MKNVADILRQAHDVLYDELDRNVREMTTDESNFIRDRLDEMDNWIQNAERKFGRADASQSCRRIASANRDEMNRRWEMWENLSEEKKQVLLDDYDVENETDLEKALEMCDDSYLIEDSEDTYDIYSGCHGKSDKRRREKKEDELESSRNAITFSKFNRISSLFIKNDVLKPGKTGIELNINGWKIINKDGKPTGGEAAEFNSEKAAKASEIYRKLADRYGEENVRTFKQD